MSVVGFRGGGGAVCSRLVGVSEWAGGFLTDSRSFLSAAPLLSTGAKVRLRVVIGVKALTICSSVSGSAAEAGPRPANNMAKAATATAARPLDIPHLDIRHLDLLRVSVI